MFDLFIKQVESDFEIKLSDNQKKQFLDYYLLLIEYNKKVNLTSITEEIEVYMKHFYDSLTMIRVLNLNHVKTICDMGAGAGFPSIPLKIIYPHLDITIIDSLGKRINFLKELLEELKINDVKLVYDRIENYAKDHHNSFDVVTARALGSLPLILELGIPMVKEKHMFVAFKGSNYQDEIDQSLHALQVLKSEIVSVKTCELPMDYGFRSHVVVRKNKDVLEYPRMYQAIKKQLL